jgi:hypothetical protein
MFSLLAAVIHSRLYIHHHHHRPHVINRSIPFHSINQSSQSEHPLIMPIYQQGQQQQIMPIPVVVVVVCGGLVVSVAHTHPFPATP